MAFSKVCVLCLLALLIVLPSAPSFAQGSFRVQCPTSTNLHGSGHAGAAGAIKCQEISGGDGFATMGDGHQIYLFGFGPLSGLKISRTDSPGRRRPLNSTRPTTQTYPMAPARPMPVLRIRPR